MKNFKCIQCGKCCKYFTDAISPSFYKDEYNKFAKCVKYDIISYLSYIGYGINIWDGWFSPRTGEELSKCPWLRKLPKKDKYKCLIHDYKPDICKDFPVDSSQLSKCGCASFHSNK